MNGQEFKTALKAIGWKQADFARKMGVHRNSVGDWCGDTGTPPAWAVSYLALLIRLKTLNLEFVEPPPPGGYDEPTPDPAG